MLNKDHIIIILCLQKGFLLLKLQINVDTAVFLSLQHGGDLDTVSCHVFPPLCSDDLFFLLLLLSKTVTYK